MWGILVALIFFVMTTVALICFFGRPWKLCCPVTNDSTESNSDAPVSSGGRSQLPLCEVSLSRELEFTKHFGNGSFGNVYLATWNSKNVVVKIITKPLDGSYEKETGVYEAMKSNSQEIKFLQTVGFQQPKKQIGTIRYMAPEILKNDFHGGCFESLKRADVYSLGLVIWQMFERTVDPSGPPTLPYRLPYEGLTIKHPTVQDMESVVCERNLRPPILNTMDLDVSAIIGDCWTIDIRNRVAATVVKQSFQAKMNSLN